MHSKIKIAFDYSTNKHTGQTYDGLPYYVHLKAVYDLLVQFKFDENDPNELPILISAPLHDIIEDTDTSYSDLKKEFGEEVAEIVYCMTDEMGRNRKEKKAKTYPKIRSNDQSIILKLADRICNVNHGISNKSSQLGMYYKENDDFCRELRIYKPGFKTLELWTYYDSLMDLIYDEKMILPF